LYEKAMKPLFLQYANNETLAGMIEDHAGRHRAYCKRHGYDYFPVVRLGEPFDWYDKIKLILEAVEAYPGSSSHVFWLDADTFVVDGTQDMRDTLPEWAAYAFCVHPKPWQGQSFHFNAGVQYYNVARMINGYKQGQYVTTSRFLESVISLNGACADEYDQTAINDLLMGTRKAAGGESEDWQRYLNVLPDKWNCMLNVHDLSPTRPPVVAAFHGTHFPEQRRELMREWAERLPYR
jgi:hypothetical protein